MACPIPTLHTEHLTLAPFQLADAAVLHRIYQHEGVLQYFPDPNPPLLDRVQRSVARQLEHWEKYSYGNWGVLPTGEAEIVGWAGLQYLPELEETEVGYLLDRPFWGKGYATEAARAAIRYAFDQIGLERLVGLVHPDNLASRRVLKKCGMVYVRTIPLWGIELRQYRKERDADERGGPRINP